MERTGKLAEIGGAAYLVMLINQPPNSLYALEYAHLIADAAGRRRLLEAANQIAALAYSSQPYTDALAEASQKMLALGERALSFKPRSLGAAAADYYDQVCAASLSDEKMAGIPTGFQELDDILQGITGGKLVIIAGRPGTGKTSFLLSMARNISLADTQKKRRILIFSLEMDEMELTERFLSQHTRINGQQLRSGRLSEDEWGRFTQATAEVGEWEVLLDTTPVLTPAQLRLKCKVQHSAEKLDLVMVDYLQLMVGGGRFENRQVEVSYISRQLKALAKELGVPVIAAAQLSRAVEQRADKRPLLSDLRESGSIEQDADQVLFLYRPEGEGSLVELDIAKHRSGPTGSARLTYLPAYTLFENFKPAK